MALTYSNLSLELRTTLEKPHIGLGRNMPRIRKGDRLPNVTLYEALSEKQTNILELVANKKAIIFGVPGAFVPGCSRVHLTGFIQNPVLMKLIRSEDLKFLGFQEIICVAVNDSFVMSAWGNSKGADSKRTGMVQVRQVLCSITDPFPVTIIGNGKQVRMLADPAGSYTKAIGMDIDIPELGGTRSRRYSMATVNGVVKELFIDSPNVKLMCLQTDGVPTYCT